MHMASRPAPRLGAGAPGLVPILVSLVLILGCSSPAATTQSGGETPAPPTNEALPSTLPTSDVPIETPPQASGGGGSIFDSHADPSLEAALPSDIGGVSLARFSLTGDNAIMQGAASQYDSLLSKLGKARGDLAMAGAADPTGSLAGSIVALRVSGADPTALLRAFLEVQGSRPSPPTASETNLGGQSVTKLAFSEPGLPYQYVLARGDVLFIVTASHDAVATSFLEALQ